jgi:hypothetical protein
LGKLPKREFQTAFPDVGTLTEAVERHQRQRLVMELPTLPEYPPFESCGRCDDVPRIMGDLVYLDAKGAACDVSQSPARTLGHCPCKRDNLAAKKAFEQGGTGV